jgi:hypothetical protein
MELEIETTDKRVLHAVMGRRFPEESLSRGDVAEPLGGVNVRYNGSIERRAIGFPEVAQFVLTLGAGVSASVVGNWLYGKLKGGRVQRIRIDRVDVQLDKENIQRVIQTSLTIEK